MVPSDQKILIDAVARFQGSLEKIDSHDHIPLPPLYRQVGCYKCPSADIA